MMLLPETQGHCARALFIARHAEARIVTSLDNNFRDFMANSTLTTAAVVQTAYPAVLPSAVAMLEDARHY